MGNIQLKTIFNNPKKKKDFPKDFPIFNYGNLHYKPYCPLSEHCINSLPIDAYNLSQLVCCVHCNHIILGQIISNKKKKFNKIK